MRTVELNNGTVECVKDNVMSLIEFVRENFSDEVGRILYNEFITLTEKKNESKEKYVSLQLRDNEKIGDLEDEINRLEKENRKLEDKVNL